MSKHKELLIRVYITALVVICVAGLLSYKAFRISVLEGDHWSGMGDSLYLKYFPIEAERGDILSRDGRILASSVPLFELRMDTRASGLTDEVFNKSVDSLAYYLSKYANTSWTQTRYRNHLIQRRTRGDRYLLIAREVNYAELERFRGFPIFRRGQNKGGLIAVKKSRRVLPYGDLAARTLGSVRENVQPVGLEGYFDGDMKGKEGTRLMQRVRNGWIPVDQKDLVEAQSGADLVTTIDVRIQDIAEGALLKRMEHHQADWGTAILMKVETGEILAIANLDKSAGGGYYEAYNNAVGKATEPGSTFKLAAVMALLEDGYANLDSRIDINGGKKAFYGRYMYDSEEHGKEEVDLREAFEISSNIGIATITDQAYGRTKKGMQFIKRINQFGLNRTTGIEILGEPAPYIKEAYNLDQKWSAMTIPWMSHGYELQITPLQTLVFYNAVANNGQMLKPRLARQIVREGKVIREFKREVVIDRIARPETIAQARELLEGVMLRGTGRRQQSDVVTMAGKTGTAVVDYFRNDGGRKKYQASFAGYFPAEDPEYSCIVLVSNPTRNGFYGGTVALPAFREIAERTMALYPGKPVIAMKDSLRHEDLKLATAFRNDVEEILEFIDVDAGSIPDKEWLMTPDLASSGLKSVDLNNAEVPNLRGMGLRDAVFLLENAGLKVRTAGAGKVRSQSLKAGTKVSRGTRIYLELG